MDNADAEPSASRQPTNTIRRRDRLRALVGLNSVTRSRYYPSPQSTSRFSLSSMFFPRRVNLHTPRPASPEYEQDGSSTTVPPTSTSTADGGDLLARLEALNDFFDDEDQAPPAPASPRNHPNRRLSLRLRDLVTIRNRAATPPSEPQPSLTYHDPSRPTPPESLISPDRPESRRMISREASTRTTLDDIQSQFRPPPLTINRQDDEVSRPSILARSRNVVGMQGVPMPRLQGRRPTWAVGRPRHSAPRPSSFLDMQDHSGTDGVRPILQPLSQPQPTNTVRESLSTQSLASASPLSSLSSLFTRTTSNQSNSSTLTPSSRNGPRSPPVLRPGAARLATPSTNASTPTSDSDMDQDSHIGRLGRMARVQTRLRRQMDNLLSRRDSDDMNDMDITSILRNIRRVPRTRGSDGSSNEGEQLADGMAPFTIVGIRRVNPGTEITGEDNLPPYIRELLGTASITDESDEDSNERRRPPILRAGRRRGVLSFYNRMESTSREQALQMLQRRRPRSLYGAGSLRRNGVVGPDSPTERDDILDDDSAEGTDTDEPTNRDDPTYIIYLISGILPENHPLLSAPSLFTNNPTYEDMLYIASLLGPGKPPVASESDVASAPGLFIIENDTEGKLFAESTETGERIALPPVSEDGFERAERCLVCLSDYEAEEEARKLVRCGHLFHKDCIDQWLTEGRNSCPLCRGDGVEEKSPSSSSTARPTPSEHPLSG